MHLFQTKEKKPLVILFSKDAISCMNRAAVASINTVDEAHYLFLKKFSQVIMKTVILFCICYCKNPNYGESSCGMIIVHFELATVHSVNHGFYLRVTAFFIRPYSHGRMATNHEKGVTLTWLNIY